MFRKSLVIVGIAFLLFVVGMSFLALWLSSPPGERFVKLQIENQLSRFLNKKVTIGSFETNVFSRVVFTDISINSDSEYSPVQFISGPYAKVTYNPRQLLNAELSIDEIILEEFKVNVLQDSTGLVNVPGIALNKSGGTTTSSILDIFVRSIDIRDLSLAYTNRIVQFNGILDGVDVSVDSSNDDGYHFSLNTDALEVNYQNQFATIENISLDGNYKNGLLTFSSVLTGNPEFKIEGEGIISLGNASQKNKNSITVHGNIKGLYQAAGDFLPAFMSNAEGDFTVLLEFIEPSDTIQLDAFVKLDNLIIRDWNFPYAGIHLNYYKKTVSVENIEAKFADGTISGFGKINAGLEYQLNLSAEKIRLEKILYAAIGKYIGLSTDVSGTVDISGSFSSGLLHNIQSHVKAAGAVYKGKALPDIDLSLSYDKKQIHGVANFNENMISMEGTVSDSLDINVDGTFSSLYTLSAILQQDIIGKGNAGCLISGPLTNPDISCTVDATNLHFRKIPVDRLTGGFDYNDSGFRLNDVRFSASGIPADSIFNAFDFEDFYGSTSYDFNISGYLSSLQGNAKISIDQPGTVIQRWKYLF